MTTGLRFCHLNVRSLLSINDDCLPRKELLFAHCCLDVKYDVIALSETHLDGSIDSNEIRFDGYTVFRRDRSRAGGGVLFYVRNVLNPVHLSYLHSSHVENLFVKVMSNNKQCIFGVCYRPPNQAANEMSVFFEGLNSQLSSINDSNLQDCPIFLLGDFNDRCTQWGIDHQCSELKFKLVCFAEEFNLVQLVTKPTRGIYILDLFFTNCPS